jgi:high frequency lysogenization protein
MTSDGTKRSREQMIALAAVVQSALLVDLLSREGAAPAADMEALAASLFRFEWERAEEVFGGLPAIRRGLEALGDMLENGAATEHRAALRYTLSMLHLGRMVGRDRGRMDAIRSRLEHAALKQVHFSSRFDENAASLAAIYQEWVSPMRFRIQVSGSARHLQDPRVAERIRALLLCGLRAAVLWRHLGGRRYRLPFERRRLRAVVDTLHALSSAN